VRVSTQKAVGSSCLVELCVCTSRALCTVSSWLFVQQLCNSMADIGMGLLTGVMRMHTEHSYKRRREGGSASVTCQPEDGCCAPSVLDAMHTPWPRFLTFSVEVACQYLCRKPAGDCQGCL
jgi:hypothetical protein